MARCRSTTPADRDGNLLKDGHQVHTRKQTRKGIYWRTPAIMVGSNLLGLAFATAHDRFYQSFHGRAVGSSFQQKVIVNVGTAFAFLVKMFFAIAAATVFEQQFFLSLRRRAETINDIDSLFGILNSVLNFGKIPLWLRHFVLAILAVVVWSIPIAAVFTPGTINVQPELTYENDILLKPAQPQQSWIGKQNFGQTQIDYTALTSDGVHTYADALLNGPSGILYSVALGSASQRDVLPIPPPNRNASYDLSFFGPALSCKSLSASDLSNFQQSVSAARRAHILPAQETTLGGVESVKTPTSLILKYNAWVETVTTGYSLSNPNWNNGTADTFYPDQANNQYFYFNASSINQVLLVCHLHNATYNVGFTFENFQQTINLNRVTLHEPVPSNGTVDVDNPNYANTVYNAVYWAFNNIVIGACTNDTGTISQNIISYGGPVLISALRDFIEGEVNLTAATVIETLETIFHNITISTLSAPALRLSDRQARFVPGSTWRSVNVYIYDPKDLYIAYGCALLSTSLCVLWGLYLVTWRNHVSYSLKFSKIVRTTRRREIDEIVSPEARKGEDPLPKEMRGSKLGYGNGIDENGGGADNGFAVVPTSGRDVEMRVNGHVAEEELPGSGLSFLPRTSTLSAKAGRDLDSGQQVRRKPVPSAQLQTY